MRKYRANVCGVRVATWGTSMKAGNGMPHFLNQKFFGGNPGHASVTVTFPADENGKELIKKYCTDPEIPYEKHVIRVPKAVKGVNPAQPQLFGATDKVIMDEEVYVVNFSWWPNRSGFGGAFAPFDNDDNVDEREGVPVEYDMKWQELLQPEQRIHRGMFGSTRMAYGLSNVIHQRGLAAKQIELLDAQAALQMAEQQLSSIELLTDKLSDKKDKIKEISSRKRKMERKDKLVDNNNAKLNALLALKKAIKKRQDPSEALSKSDKKLLSKILPKWQAKPDLKKIEKKIKKRKETLKLLADDSLEKVKQDKVIASQFTTTEMLLLNRLLPDWREDDNDPSATRKKLNSLSKKARKKSKNLTVQIEALENKISQLEKEARPQGVIDYYADNEKLIKKRDLSKLLTYFAALPANNKGHIAIDQDVLDKLDLFKTVTGTAWKKTLVKPYKGKYRYMRKKEIALLKSTLEAQLDSLQDVGYRADADEDYRHIMNQQHCAMWYSIYDKLNLLMDPRSSSYLQEDESAEIQDILQEKLDNAFWLINRPWHGQDGFVKDRKKITQAEATRLFAFVQGEMTKARHKMVDEEVAVGRFNQNDFAHFLTRGHPPDLEVRLPLDAESKASNYHDEGMNVEAMLQEMQRIAKNEQFDLHSNNCSSTVSKILQAGAPNPYLKGKFKNRALGAIANPQMVLENAMSYQNALYDPKDSWLKKLSRFNPMERLGGWCLNKLIVEKNVNVPTKVAAGLLACVAWPYAAVKMAVKKAMNPLQSFKELRDFASYANSTNSVGFKVTAAAAYVLPMVVLAPFAAVQYGIKKVAKGVGSLLQKVTGKKPKISPPTYFDLSPEQLKEHEQKQRIFNQATKELLSKLVITEISATTLDEVSIQFEKQVTSATIAYALNEFKDNHYPMIVLSRDAAMLFEKEIDLKRRSNDPSEIAKATELEKKYHSFLNSNMFFMTMINHLVQKKYAEKLEQSLDNQPVDAQIIHKAAEQARLDFLKDFNRVPSEKTDAEGIRRQRMRQAAFAQFAEEDESKEHEAEKATDSEPTNPSPPKPNKSVS